MAYATTILFYGWTGSDARRLVETILNDKLVIFKNINDDMYDQYDALFTVDELIKNINIRLHKIVPELTFDVFGIYSNEPTEYLYFGIDKYATCDENCIGTTGYTIEDLIKLVDTTRIFHQKYLLFINFKPMINSFVSTEEK